MPPLIRRPPLIERIKAYLDPYDLLLWLLEELNDDGYDELLNEWATPIGVSLNITFILARGASKAGTPKGRDDVFGDFDERKGSGWFTWLTASLVHVITLLCCLNALYTFFRKKHYRLFEQPIDVAPATPMARRVPVDSSPMSHSPLRYLKDVIARSTAASRAYPDAEREVWEVSVWDPKPFHLTIFTLFSPGHLLLYYTLLPPAVLDPRPSVTVLLAITFGALLSLQLGLLRTSFSQQAKGTALIHGEVMSEYDTKFVHPSLNRVVRDVGVQTRESTLSPVGTRTREVDVYTPTGIINRGFRTNPNTNYAKQYDPHDLASKPDTRRRSSAHWDVSAATPTLNTPASGYVNGFTQSQSVEHRGTFSTDFSSPLKPHHERLRERSPVKGDGGSLGVYNHSASPLRKAASSTHLRRESENRKSSGLLRRTNVLSNGDGQRDARRRETGRF